MQQQGNFFTAAVCTHSTDNITLLVCEPSLKPNLAVVKAQVTGTFTIWRAVTIAGCVCGYLVRNAKQLALFRWARDGSDLLLEPTGSVPGRRPPAMPGLERTRN